MHKKYPAHVRTGYERVDTGNDRNNLVAVPIFVIRTYLVLTT